MQIFVAGGASPLGATVLANLAARGHTALALARSQDQATRLQQLGAVAVPGDVLAPSTYQHALKGLDAICDLTHATLASPWDTETQPLRDLVLRYGAQALASAARQERVGYYLLLSADWVYRPQGEVTIDEESPQGFGDALQSLRDAEAAVATSGVPFAVLRAGAAYGNGTERSRRLLEGVSRGVLHVLDSGERWLSPIHLSDLARAVGRCLEARPSGRAYNVCDGDPLTERALYEALASARSVEVKFGESPPADAGRRLSCARITEELGFAPSAGGALRDMQRLLGETG